MLYRDLMLHLNVKDTSRRRHVHSLDQIGAFEFGEKFNIVRLNGTRVELRHLDTLLECIQDEFKEADTYDYTLYLAGKKNHVLTLHPEAVMGTPWNRNIHKTCNNIRDWVTEFTLSEQWPEEVLGLAQRPTPIQGKR